MSWGDMRMSILEQSILMHRQEVWPASDTQTTMTTMIIIIIRTQYKVRFRVKWPRIAQTKHFKELLTYPQQDITHIMMPHICVRIPKPRHRNCNNVGELDGNR